MSFLKGSVTFRRFRVNGPKPRVFGEEHLDRLRDHKAGSQRIASADGLETGWSGGSHVFDYDFNETKNVFPDHLCFDFWTQIDRLPQDRLRAYYEADLKALTKDNPSGYPSARQRREARESAKERLQDEAKDGRYRKWKCVPIAWDAITNEILFGATSAAAADRFIYLFGRTFEQNLFAIQQQDFARGVSIISAGERAVAINEKAKHENLSPFVVGTTPGDRPIWCPSDDNVDWLGNEFLLWLWYHHDREGDTISLGDGSDVTFMFSGGIKVEDPREMKETATLNSQSAVRMHEAKAAVKNGKLPRKAAMTVVRNDEQFSCILQAESLTVSSAKLPAPPDDVTNQRDREVHRLQCVRDLAETIDLMFQAFIGRRMSGYWSGELKEIQAWLKGSRKAVA